MSTDQPTDDPVVHFLSAVSVATSMSPFGSGRVFAFGDQLVVTPEIREANRDRTGASFFDWLDGTADALVRNGRTICARGPWPEGRLRLEPGSPAWEDARQPAISQALAITDPEERGEARRQVDVEFGTPGPTSRTLQEIKYHDGAAR